MQALPEYTENVLVKDMRSTQWVLRSKDFDCLQHIWYHFSKRYIALERTDLVSHDRQIHQANAQKYRLYAISMVRDVIRLCV